MNKLIYSFLFFLLVLASACDEDSFSSVVDIEIPEHTPLPVLSLELNSQDTTIQVLVSKSQAITGDPDFEIIEDATVRIFKNDNLWQEPVFDTEIREYLVENIDGLDTDNAEYRIEVDVPGFDKVSATQTLPAEAVIENLTIAEETTLDAFGERAHDVTFDIVDNGNEDNYYSIEVYLVRVDDFSGAVIYDNLYFDSPDPLIEYGYETMLINDATFNGQSYRIRTPINLWQVEEFKSDDILMVSIRNLTRDNYLYSRTLSLYQDANGNPFAEPVVVHNNVENGYGIFRLGTESNALLEF